MPIKIYKPIGITPLQLIKKYKRENNIKEKISFAGRLDPMAHGEMVLLKGDECKKQDSFCGKDKIYEFEILYGFTTDSLDILGISSEQEIRNDFKNKNFEGEYLQPYPIYSSKTITLNNKKIPLWKYASLYKIDKEIIPKKRVNVYKMEKLGENRFNNTELLEMILNKLSLLSEEYREKFRYFEIKNLWESNLSKDKRLFKVEKYRVTVSSGTYIRSLCERMGGIAYDIKRVAVL